MSLGERLQAGLERARGVCKHPVVAVLFAPDRHIAADLVEYLAQRLLVDVVCSDRQPRRHHAAADIHADRRRHDGLVRGNHRSDGGADAQVHIRHRGNMVMDEGQARDVGEQRERFFVDVDCPDADGDGRVCEGFLNWHWQIRRSDTPTVPRNALRSPTGSCCSR